MVPMFLLAMLTLFAWPALFFGRRELAKGEAGNPIVGATLIVVGAVALFIGIFVVGEVDDAIDRSGWTAEMNTSFTGIRTNAFSAFTLMGVALIVIGAGFIIGYLRGGAFGGR